MARTSTEKDYLYLVERCYFRKRNYAVVWTYIYPEEIARFSSLNDAIEYVDINADENDPNTCYSIVEY